MRASRSCTLDLKLAAALTAAVSVLFLLPLLWGWRYFGLDLARVDLGLTCEIQHLLEADLPLWLSPRLGDGGPLWARPTAQLLYPLRWIGLLVFSPDAAVSVHVALHMGLMAGGGALLLRAFGVRPTVAAVGGLTLSLTGTSVDLIGHTSYLVGGAWLGWAWAFVRWLLVPSRRGWGVVGLTVVLACMLVGGEPQSFATACGLWVLELLARARLRRGLLWPAVLGAAAVVTAVMLAAPALLPTLVEATLTPRAEGFSQEALISIGLFRPAGWWALVLPLDLDFDPAARALDALYGRDHQLWNAHPYVGLALLGAALVGLGRRRCRVPLVVVIGGLALAVGQQTPLFKLGLTLFPPLGMFRFPAKHLVVVGLALLVAAFVLVDGARAPQGLTRLRRGLGLGMGLGVVLSLLAVLSKEGVSAVVLPLMPGAVLTAGLALAVSFTRHQRAAVVAAAVVVGVASATLPFVDVGPPMDDVPPLASRFGVGPGARLCVDEHSLENLPGHPDIPWDRAVAERAAGVPEMGACHDYSTSLSYTTLQTSAEVALMLSTRGRFDPAAYRAMGCEQVQLGDRETFVRVVPVERPQPEAWVVRAPREVPPADTALAALDDQGATPSTIDRPLGGMAVPLPSGEGATLARAAWEDPSTIHVEVTGAPAVVGLRTSFRRGWVADQGGRLLPLVRVAATKLAVVIDTPAAGEVVLRYRPPRLGLGVALAVLGLCVLVFMTLGAAVMGPRRRT